jgi:hypothetical protein
MLIATHSTFAQSTMTNEFVGIVPMPVEFGEAGTER